MQSKKRRAARARSENEKAVVKATKLRKEKEEANRRSTTTADS